MTFLGRGWGFPVWPQAHQASPRSDTSHTWGSPRRRSSLGMEKGAEGKRGEAGGCGLQPALLPPHALSFGVNTNMPQSPRNLLGCLPCPGRTPLLRELSPPTPMPQESKGGSWYQSIATKGKNKQMSRLIANRDHCTPQHPTPRGLDSGGL